MGGAGMTDTGGVERAGDGFVVDAAVLAAAFRVPAGEVRALMQEGRITSRCEAGAGADVGRWRLTFYHAGRVCRLTVDADGALLGRTTYPARARKEAPGG